MSAATDRPWAQVERDLQQLGLDPRRLACGCAIKVDLRRVVYPAIAQLRALLARSGITVSPRQDADVTALRDGYEVRRLVSSLSHVPRLELQGFAPQRAIVLSAVYRAHDSQALVKRWLPIYRALADQHSSLVVGKGHTIEAYSPDDEFFVLDLMHTLPGVVRGQLAANNDTIQLIDPSLEPTDFRQVAAALSNALNDLFALGAVQNVKVFPMLAAPRALQADIQNNVRRYCQEHELTYVEQPFLSESTLLLGATVIGQTDRQVPVFHDQLRPGDLILVHRPFGDLAPFSLWLEGLVMGQGYLDGLGIDSRQLQQTKNHVLSILTKPNLDVGELIRTYCPAMDEAFDPQRHIKCTADISGPGIDVFRELAERAQVTVHLDRVPLLHPAVVKAATQQMVLRDGTAGTNGALAIVASPSVIDAVGNALQDLGHRPLIMGRVSDERDGKLIVPAETRDYISDWPHEYSIAES